MTARERYAALVAKLQTCPARPMDALSPAEREEYAALSRRFRDSHHDAATARRMGL